ncbi:MAG: hypothetical protein H6747_06760 [Deltaproteobacteria bacterium]|nr:hypothetical protein [Deltaproteobacteria bacterium]
MKATFATRFFASLLILGVAAPVMAATPRAPAAAADAGAPEAAAAEDGATTQPRPRGFRAASGLTVRVEYLGAAGRASLHARGSTYHLEGKAPHPGSVYYPEPYWSDAYALFRAGQPMRLRVTVENRGKRALKGAQLVAVQEHLDYFGKDGEDVDGAAAQAIALPSLKPGATWQQELTLTLPMRLLPGLLQTHVQLVQQRGKRSQLLLDEPQAGLFCPLEPRRAGDS